MTRISGLVAALLAVLLLAAQAPAYAAPAPPCTVEPDPVLLYTDTFFTVTAVGGVPGEIYEVTIFQKGNGINDERRIWSGPADENGTVTAVVYFIPEVEGYSNALWAGEPRLNVVRYRTGGGPGGAASTLARCTFTVLA